MFTGVHRGREWESGLEADGPSRRVAQRAHIVLYLEDMQLITRIP